MIKGRLLRGEHKGKDINIIRSVGWKVIYTFPDDEAQIQHTAPPDWVLALKSNNADMKSRLFND